MNKAILIVICDFLVSAMLTMMTGMVPGHSGGTGVGLDEKTTKILLQELNRRQFELEAARLQLREVMARTGATPEQHAELKKITEELIANLAKQDQLQGKLIAKAADPADVDSLRSQLATEELRRKELESELQRIKKDFTGNLEKLTEVTGELRDKRRDNAVLTRQLESTRDALGEAGKKLDDARKELIREKEQHSETKIQLTAAEKDKAAARRDADEKGLELKDARKNLDKTRDELLAETRAHGVVKEKLAASESGRAAAEKDAAEKGKALDSARKERDDERAAHSASKTELARMDTSYRLQQRTIRNLQGDLQGKDRALIQASKEVDVLKLAVKKNEGTIEAIQQNNAEQKDENRRLSQELMVAKLEKQDAITKAQMLRETFQETVKELVAKEQELEKVKSEKQDAAMEAALKIINQQQNTGVSTEVRKEVFSKYAGAILRVDAAVREKTGLFGSEVGGTVTSYYPVVDFGSGRILITGAFNRFAGDLNSVLNFEKVSMVEMSWAQPLANWNQERKVISGGMMVNAGYPHLAGFIFQNTEKSIVPLKAIDFKTLKMRGVDGLFLFKSDAEAMQTQLEGRVSLINDNGVPALFIRNGGRGMMNAAPGDVILTVQGEFAGIAARKARFNNREGVIVPLFNDPAADWNDPVAVRLTAVKEGDYSDFAVKIKELRKKFPR